MNPTNQIQEKEAKLNTMAGVLSGALMRMDNDQRIQWIERLGKRLGTKTERVLTRTYNIALVNEQYEVCETIKQFREYGTNGA